MNARQSRMQLCFITFCSVTFFIVLFALLRTSRVAAAEDFSATWARGGLSVFIPYHAERAGSGHLVLELLDPEDHILAKAERPVEVARGDGRWRQEIGPDKPLPLDDLVWERLRYRFIYDGETAAAFERTSTVSEILRRPLLRLFGQKSYLAGSQAAVRVIVTDTNDEPLSGRSFVRIELVSADHQARQLFSGHLDRRGTADAQLHFPAGLTGSFELHTVAETPIGTTEYTQPIKLEDTASILLTTEKPIYQPGQEIHVRALALDRANRHAAADRKLTFEVEDSRGNKVFKKITHTDAFGIASAEFDLADEVNLGTYHLRALMGEGDAPSTTAEAAINVERYVLPKFKVAIDFAQKDGKPKRDYRPGDHVTGTVQTNYFFGKAVDGAVISIKASGMDVAVFDAVSASGKTDKDGAYHFDLKLPSYFAGRSVRQGAARVLVEATVTDAAGHAESRGEPITVSQSALLLTAVPEGGKLVPGLENQVFVLASYPDGSPALAQLVVHAPDAGAQSASTDVSGIAVVRLKPGAGAETLKIDADDHRGNRASSSVPLESRGGTDQILLRTARSVYRAGERMELQVFSTKQSGSVYVDVVKDGQTVLTRDLDINDGRAELTLSATPEMAGTLDINAYLIGRDAQAVGDHRLVFVQPADELKIEAVADAQQYKPGADARIRFHVTNAHGEGVSAALGLQVVDEAVFALAEKQPGFAKVFFYLEQEAMKPRYEIHSLSMDSIVEPVTGAEAEQQDRAARVLFSANEMVNSNAANGEAGRDVPQTKYAEFFQRYHTAFATQVEELATRLTEQLKKQPPTQEFSKLFERTLVDGGKVRDAWGNGLRVEPTGWSRGPMGYYIVHSAGPDGRFNTGDDLFVYVQTRTGNVGTVPAQRGGSIDLRFEHDRGPFNGRAEITGAVVDRSGAVIPNARITLRPIPGADLRHTNTDNRGEFTLAGLVPGKYSVEITAMGFMTASREITLGIRDRAVLSTTLDVGSVMETVMVDGAADSVEVSAQVIELPIMGRSGAAMAAPMPMAAGIAGGMGSEMRFAKKIPTAQPSGLAEAEAPAAHVRSYFPEALYINPEIITDGSGHAQITIPMADSITTWQMAMLASTRAGALGTGTSSLKVFQDFFVDLDLPVTLTQGDRVSIPVAVYNYTSAHGDVTLSVKPDDWFALVDDNASKDVTVEGGHVGGSQFTLQANRIGKFKLTLSAKMRGKDQRQDIVVREIEVVPNGREQNIVFNGRLESSVSHTVSFPANAIPDASKVFVRLYPGPLSQVIEGMDGILRMPSGCFEQTSSSTYPNVLALDYMRRTKKLAPEVHAKAEGFIANGYQRLLTFEVPGGGFSWFGQAPANKILTAYGLMEFSDMAKVYDIDTRLIERTRDWLAGLQQPDGSWKPDTNFINEGATNRFNSDVLRITAYIAWALENSGYQGPAVERAKRYIETHSEPKADAYTLAVLANFAVDYGKDREFTRQAMQQLLDARTEKDDQAFWTSAETGVYSAGSSASIETTGLAVQALLKWGQASEVSRKALNFITAKKDASGNWGTTQATIMALRALLLASEKSSADVRGAVSVTLNGKVIQRLELTPENNDLLHQFVLPGIGATNEIKLQFQGTGGLAYQVAARYFVPWEDKSEREAFSIDVSYDRTRLAENDIATATATIKSNLNKTAKMVMVDLGIPPGFDLLSEDLQSYSEKSVGNRGGHLEKFSLTATQAILYFDALAPHQTITLHYRLRAKYPIRARTFQSRVYEYYDPDVNAVARPLQLEVGKR
jgi:uncharacterized protein YfaS (alpha-2-macroglobulin family)